MNLDRITVRIRPRNQWEAMDIGLFVSRYWFARLWRLWCIAALPFIGFFIPLGYVLPGSAFKWGLLFFWLCKPLYEPPLLYWASRALFDERLTTRQTLEELKAVTSFPRILAIFSRRLNPMRSFTMPVLLLEGLTGKRRKKRLSLLSKGYETAFFLGLAGFFIEIIFCLSLVGIAYWFIPEELRWIDFGDFVLTADTWLVFFAYVLSCSLVAPFYTCAGFMLYISRRVELEAWDIEIGFKRMERRLKERRTAKLLVASTLLLSLLSGILYGNNPALASSPDPETARTAISEVMNQKEFGAKKTIYRWVPKEIEKKGDNYWQKVFEALFEELDRLLEKIGPVLAKVVRVLAWFGAGLIIAFIVLKYTTISSWLADRFHMSRPKLTPPEILFGLDIRPQSLPEDIPNACLDLLDNGEKRQALSLLYRGTLSRLVNSYRVDIAPSLTEYECCGKIDRCRPSAESTYFTNLTGLWLTTAYGHREPDPAVCRTLIGGWSSLFGG